MSMFESKFKSNSMLRVGVLYIIHTSCPCAKCYDTQFHHFTIVDLDFLEAGRENQRDRQEREAQEKQKELKKRDRAEVRASGGSA